MKMVIVFGVATFTAMGENIHEQIFCDIPFGRECTVSTGTGSLATNRSQREDAMRFSESIISKNRRGEVSRRVRCKQVMHGKFVREKAV